MHLVEMSVVINVLSVLRRHCWFSCWHGWSRRHGWGRGLGGEMVTPKARPPEAEKTPIWDTPTDYGGWGNVVSFPSGVRGRKRISVLFKCHRMLLVEMSVVN